jgi:hypothetical protein
MDDALMIEALVLPGALPHVGANLLSAKISEARDATRIRPYHLGGSRRLGMGVGVCVVWVG